MLRRALALSPLMEHPMAENIEGALSRRSLVAAAGAASTITASPALASPDIPSPQGAGFYRFRLGDAEALVVSDGDADFPGWPLWSTNAPRAAFEALQRERFFPWTRSASIATRCCST